MESERSAADRLQGEHAAGASDAGWNEDVRVDPERQREILTGGMHAHGAYGGHPADVASEGADEPAGYAFVDRRSGVEPADARELVGRTSTLHAAGEGAARTGRPERDAARDTHATRDTTPRDREGLLGTLVRGAIAGAVGALAMSLTHRASSKVLLGSVDAAPNPANAAAEALGEKAGVQLSDGQAAAGGTALMVGYGALLGAVYGVVQERAHPPALLHALALGGLSYAATVPQKGLLPRLGLVAPPTEQSLLAAMVPMDAHVAYGVTTAAVFEAMT